MKNLGKNQKRRAPCRFLVHKGLVMNWEHASCRRSGKERGQSVPPIAARLRDRGISPVAVVLLGRDGRHAPANLVCFLALGPRLDCVQWRTVLRVVAMPAVGPCGRSQVPVMNLVRVERTAIFSRCTDLFLLTASAVQTQQRLMVEERLVVAPELATSRAALAALVVGRDLLLRIVHGVARINHARRNLREADQPVGNEHDALFRFSLFHCLISFRLGMCCYRATTARLSIRTKYRILRAIRQAKTKNQHSCCFYGLTLIDSWIKKFSFP